MRTHLGITTLIVLFTLICGCSGSGGGDPITSEFVDDFNRSELGSHWRNTGADYKIVNNELHIEGAKNHPLWLRKVLPDKVRVTFDVRSESSDGDIKFELFGDGVSYARESSYVASGYVLIFGGWNNSLNVIARMDEHASNRRVKRGPRVIKGKKYQLKAERRDNVLRWWVDDELMLEFDDAEPLKGRGHNHFGFNNWNAPLYFDNLRITPL